MNTITVYINNGESAAFTMPETEWKEALKRAREEAVKEAAAHADVSFIARCSSRPFGTYSQSGTVKENGKANWRHGRWNNTLAR